MLKIVGSILFKSLIKIFQKIKKISNLKPTPVWALSSITVPFYIHKTPWVGPLTWTCAHPAKPLSQEFRNPQVAAEVALSVAGTRQMVIENIAIMNYHDLKDFARMKDIQPKRLKKQELQDLVVYTT